MYYVLLQVIVDYFSFLLYTFFLYRFQWMAGCNPSNPHWLKNVLIKEYFKFVPFVLSSLESTSQSRHRCSVLVNQKSKKPGSIVVNTTLVLILQCGVYHNARATTLFVCVCERASARFQRPYSCTMNESKERIFFTVLGLFCS